MKEFFKNLFSVLDNADKKSEYKFTTTEDLVLKISAMRTLGKSSEALALYEKYEFQIREDTYELNGLTEIIKAAEESANIEALIKHTKRLKVIAHLHPYVVQLSKIYKI